MPLPLLGKENHEDNQLEGYMKLDGAVEKGHMVPGTGELSPEGKQLWHLNQVWTWASMLQKADRQLGRAAQLNYIRIYIYI